MTATGAGRSPTIALLGAFPFPYPQGSQVYVAEQARALAAAGARPLLVTYGRGRGAVPLDLEHETGPTWLAPRALRSGPQWGKPLADLALVGAQLAAHRRHGIDLVLAHNAEAAVVGLATRFATRAPVVYVAHTILEWELPAYAGPRWRDPLARFGRRLDRWIAGACDGVIALSEAGRSALEPFARGPVALIPPGLDPAAEPDAAAQGRACARAGVQPRAFALYAGNLDGYQDLDLLAGAARRLSELEGSRAPVVIATHDAQGSDLARGARPGLRIIELDSFDEVRALTFAAGVLVATRRRRGGFPVKLLNYMESGRPIIAFDDVAEPLTDDENARLLPASAGEEELAIAIAALLRDPDRARRLGDAGRNWLEVEHGWRDLAKRTLEFAEKIRATQPRR